MKITITKNLKTGNFFDVTFNLCTGKYQPYNKPNDTPTYINANSNHPPNIIKALPNSISQRVSNISSDKATFNNAVLSYNDALSTSGYKENLSYQLDLTPSKKVRQRKIIWFNPPYSVNVETNIGKTFLNLIDRHFLKINKFHKIFNRNNVKVSYSCLPNFGNMIKSHNNRILSEEKTQDQPKCNCQQKDTCPLEGPCLEKELIYQCILKENTTSGRVTYNGLTENSFKDQFYKHRSSFKYESKANSTELSKHFWEMKRNSIKKPIMHWLVIDHAKPYQNRSKRCILCLTEKYHILTSPVNLISKRSELVSKCHHESKFHLGNYRAIPPDN